MPHSFSNKIEYYSHRINQLLDRLLPQSEKKIELLHEAMRYAVLSEGKRVRPLLVYAVGECLNIKKNLLDIPAITVELMHAFSLVHDDLPSMDNDDFRRGLPTVHKKYGEATAILAADALQFLAFQQISESSKLTDYQKVQIINLISNACGSNGMIGGQHIDLSSENKELNYEEIKELHLLKTGALIHASVITACYLSNEISQSKINALGTYGKNVGLAFQIRDDILDAESINYKNDKNKNSDEVLDKATWPKFFGLDESENYCNKLINKSTEALKIFPNEANMLRKLITYLIKRSH